MENDSESNCVSRRLTPLRILIILTTVNMLNCECAGNEMNVVGGLRRFEGAAGRLELC